MATRNVLERAILLLEGYFQALYVPLGGLKTRMENTPSRSMKFYISIFSDKPPCMPLYFGITIVLPEVVEAFSLFISSFLASAAAAFSSFLASAATTFSSFSASATRAFSSAFSSCLAFFFHFLFFLRLFLQLFLLS